MIVRKILGANLTLRAICPSLREDLLKVRGWGEGVWTSMRFFRWLHIMQKAFERLMQPEKNKICKKEKRPKKSNSLATITNTWWNTHALVSTYGTHLNAELRTHPHEGLSISWVVAYKMSIVAWHVYLTKWKNRFFWIKEFAWKKIIPCFEFPFFAIGNFTDHSSI